MNLLDNSLLGDVVHSDLLLLSVDLVGVSLMYDWHVSLSHFGNMLFMDDWLMMLVNVLLDHDWLMVLVDHSLMMLMHIVLLVFNEDILADNLVSLTDTHEAA